MVGRLSHLAVLYGEDDARRQRAPLSQSLLVAISITTITITIKPISRLRWPWRCLGLKAGTAP